MTPSNVALAARELSAGYDKRLIIERADLSIAAGGITALVGPNGSGKSTLLKTMARLLSPSAGSVLLDGADIARLPTARIARQMAILPQSPSAPTSMTVRELVEQGRYPHVGALRMLRAQDHESIDRALAMTDMARFASRSLDNLSGGERQRAWIALALAQDTPILLLDEPTTFLDIGHQLETLDLVARLNRERGMTIVMVLHDLNQAARYADRMVVLEQGRIVADGAPKTVLTPLMLRRVFGIDAHIIADPEIGCPVALPYRVSAAAAEPGEKLAAE